MTESLILAATFFSVLVLCFIIFTFYSSRRRVSERLHSKSEKEDIKIDVINEDISGLKISERELLQNYFNVIRNDHKPNSLQNRLINAGYFSPRAALTFQVIRLGAAALVFLGIFVVVPVFFVELNNLTVIIIGLLGSGLVFIICNILLERRGKKRQIEYRKTFPDFLDTLMVCLDAGMSIEAAFNRVAKEFIDSPKRDFGLHLAIMMLEVRGGRRLRDALTNLSKRLIIDEARALAVLFRQSEELGASVTKTLRVFSQDMRDRRIIRAEEKANTLPIKMLFPLSVFLFPISLLIVIVPIAITVLGVLTSLSPR